MRIFVYSLFVSLCVCLVACNTDNVTDIEVDNATYNQEVIDYLQKKYDVDVEVDFAPTFKERLSRQDIESLEDYFKFVGGLKRKPLKMNLQDAPFSTTRAETASFSQELMYNGDRINVYVHYDLDGNGGLASPPNVVAGMGGSASDNESFGHQYPTINTTYEIYYWGGSVKCSNTRIDIDRMRVDYTLKHYNIVNGVRSDTWYAMTKTKLAAYGYVNVANNSGEFQLVYCGAGSWMQTIIDEDLKKDLNP